MPREICDDVGACEKTLYGVPVMIREGLLQDLRFQDGDRICDTLMMARFALSRGCVVIYLPLGLRPGLWGP